MKSKLKNFVLILLGAGLGWLVLKWYRTPNFGNGAKAPDFVGRLVNGDSMRLSDLSGNIVLLDFWGSWCAPCRRANADLVMLYDRFHNANFKDAKNFEIVSIGIETDSNRWQNAIQHDQLHWQWHISDLQRFNDHVALLYGVKEIPNTFLIDEKGVIIGVNLTKGRLQEALERKLNQ